MIDSQDRANTASASYPNGIAIVGMACRFPGAPGVAAFWDLLLEGRDAISEIPRSRFDIDALYARTPATPGKLTSRFGGFLDDVDRFDAGFFGLSPREASRMDPQQRILLEVAWEAVEDARLTLTSLRGSPTGVYIGCIGQDYAHMQLSKCARDTIDFYTGIGGAHAIIAGRLSYAFDLRGPSLAVDTACSSSLTALHLACQSLLSRETTLAIVGGVNLVLLPEPSLVFERAGMLAPDGRCKFGDAQANGFVRSDGVGIVILKPVAKALEDGDAIHAVILGSASTNDGQSSGLLATPGRGGQEAVLRQAYRNARISPGDVQYVEAHGTGTTAGDPVEIQALSAVLSEGRNPDSPCIVGSVKTNIGHAEGAAGVAGLIKAVLTLQHGVIPPSLHFRTPNPGIPWHELPLTIPGTRLDWPGAARPRLAGVSSFGISGTNVHVVLREALFDPHQSREPVSDSDPASRSAPRTLLLPISAASRPALDALVDSYRQLLSSDSVDLELLCHAASRHRTHLRHRLGVTGSSVAEIRERLTAHAEGRPTTGVSIGPAWDHTASKLVFVFPGQGSQWAGMGRQLMECEPVFRDTIGRCEEAMRPFVSWSLAQELAAGSSKSRFEEVDVIQPALFAMQVALAALWQSWGIVPEALVGHSMGEVAAAYVAGILTLDDAARVICRRSQLVRRISGRGGMLFTELSLVEAQRAVADYEGLLSVAVSNSRTSTVISGEIDAIQKLLRSLEDRQIFCKLVNVDYAAHSPQIDELRPDLMAALEPVRPRPPRLPLFSTVVGACEPTAMLDGDYWVRNLRAPVLFSSAVRALVGSGHNVYLEISPHPLLLSAIQQELLAAHVQGFAVGSLRKDEDEEAELSAALSTLYTLGRDPEWSALYPDVRRGSKVTLPSYPWQRTRLWRDDANIDGAAGIHPLLNRHLTVGTHDGMHLWHGEVKVSDLPYLADHRVQGHIVLPAACYLETALAAADVVFGPGPHELHSFRFENAFFLDDAAVKVQTVVTMDGSDSATFQYLSARSSNEAGSPEWRRHTVGTLRRGGPDRSALSGSNRRTLSELDEPVAASDHYRALQEHGLEYGPAFQGVCEAWRSPGECLAKIRAPDDLRFDTKKYRIHPALLDSCFQVLGGIGYGSGMQDPDTTYVPVALDSLRIGQVCDTELWAHGIVGTGSPAGNSAPGVNEVRGDITVTDRNGEVVIHVEGLTARSLEPERVVSQPALEQWLYELQWDQLPHEALAAEGTEVPAVHRNGSCASLHHGTWLLLMDRHGIGDSLRVGLEALGYTCLTVHQTTEEAGIRKLLERIQEKGSLVGIVHLWSLDAALVDGNDPASDSTLVTDAVLGCHSLAQVVQSLECQEQSAPRLWIVTRDAVAVAAHEQVTALSQSSLWGLGRVIASEHPELRCTLVDVGSETAIGIRDLLRLLTGNSRETQLALRNGFTYAARLKRSGSNSAAERTPPGNAAAGQGRIRPALPDEQFRLAMNKTGILDDLVFRGVPREAPPEGCVEIRVHAAGVNFQDTMLAVGVLPPELGSDGRIQFGWDCAGTVTATGPGVQCLKAGDAVVGIARPCFAKYVVTPAPLVVRKPENITFEEAATIPVAFMTAFHGLCRSARLQSGERVLIHAAAGGVGLAAVQVARHLGAEIFSTAGSEEKREFLRSLGIRHVMDSRSLAFADQIRDATGGEGVDVVLNSIAGDFITRSMEILRPHGRFVEIGKMDILQNSKIGLRLFMNNVSFFALDYSQIILKEPERFNPILQEVVDFFARGVFTPIRHQVFVPADVVTAFRRIATAKQIGKAVIGFENHSVPVEPLREERPLFMRDRTYLITGGIRGLGLAVAEWMAQGGAGRIVLLGRHGPPAEAEPSIQKMQRAGAEVRALQADVADTAQMKDVFSDIRASGRPLAGIVHAAVVLDDAAVANLDRERFERVMLPKIAGAWNLHRLTLEEDLDFFLLFSSAASVLGSPGQGNYSAANAFLDALACYRRGRGQRCTTINWGPWSDVGVAARTGVDKRLASRGLGKISPADGLAALSMVLSRDMTQVCVLPWDLQQWSQFHPAAAESPTLQAVMSEVSAGTPRDSEIDLDELRGLSRDGRAERIERYLAQQINRILGFGASESQNLNTVVPLSHLGIDSLMATELRNVVAANLRVTIPVMELLKGRSLSELARYTAEHLDRSSSEAGELIKKLDTLSDEEVDQLLASKLVQNLGLNHLPLAIIPDSLHRRDKVAAELPAAHAYPFPTGQPGQPEANEP